PNKPRDIDHGRIECDRVCQLFTAIDHLINQCLPGWYVESIDAPKNRRQQENMPQLIVTVEYNRCECERLNQRGELRRHQYAKAVVAIRDNTANCREKKRRKLRTEHRDAEQKCRVG